MKELFNKYKDILVWFYNKKVFVICFLIIAILSFGFTITNHSIGVDDTCLDRYYTFEQEYADTNMITAGRWGSFVLYYVLDLVSFTPFWLDCLTVLIMMMTAIILCAFIKDKLKDRIGIGAYIVFACIYISYPLINEAFIYQASNIAVMLSTLLTVIAFIIFYDSFFEKISKSIYLVIVTLLTFSIAMYESCCQTLLVLVFITILFELLFTKKIKAKEIIKIGFQLAGLLVVSIIFNYIILQLFYVCGIQNNVSGSKDFYWGKCSISESIQLILKYINEATIKNTKYFPVEIFNITVVIGFVISVIQAYKKQNVMILLLYIGAVLANFAFVFLQLKGVLYRTCTSWSLFVAIVFMIFYIYMSKYKATKILSAIFIVILVLQQSRYLNQMFYNDYIRYQRDLHIAYELIDDLETSYDISKPIVIAGWPKQSIGKDGAQVNSLSVLWWGKKAFADNGAEFIKFLNSLGYNFKKPNDEQYEKGTKEAENMTNYPKEGSIKELEDCIVINF